MQCCWKIPWCINKSIVSVRSQDIRCFVLYFKLWRWTVIITLNFVGTVCFRRFDCVELGGQAVENRFRYVPYFSLHNCKTVVTFWKEIQARCSPCKMLAFVWTLHAVHMDKRGCLSRDQGQMLTAELFSFIPLLQN